MSLTVVKKKLQIMSTNSRESHKETNTIPKTDDPQSQSGFPVGLTSVSDRQELLLVYFQFFLLQLPALGWFTRQQYCVVLKRCSSPLGSKSPASRRSPGDLSKHAHHSGTHGDERHSRSIRENGNQLFA